MKILVINCGSSSLKYQLLDMTNEGVMAKGLVERIGIEGSKLTQKVEGRDKYIVEKPLANHQEAIQLVIDALIDEKNGVIKSMDEIAAVGHRVVHGGEKYAESVIIDDSVMKALNECVKLAPLHNPPNITGIEACRALMPNVPMVAVFDTAFHQTMPKESYIYALPYELYEKYGVRRYGFHGTSHKYVSQEAAKMIGKDIKDLKLVVCHLGNGASITAVKNGKSFDTSMGFTPLEGLVMGTRSGDLDPAVVTYLMKQLNISADEMDNILNKKSGILGISGVSSDFRDVEDEMNAGHERCKLALDIFHYRVRKYIGSYVAAMDGIDALIFTAGLGENSPETREEVCNGLGALGIKIEKSKNNFKGRREDISAVDSKVKVFVIPTDEELMIARDTLNLVK
ncbi:acetate kinase [Clostridium thermarum]|uniref:acetate kinase n=1 Tax=Clostridium thermarum TaxID=1716543 RepID=UPI0011215D22|nr:acetate kinase [Clostridium thermarum]